MAQYFVYALERGLIVMEAFNNQSKPLRLSDVAQITGMSLPMAGRYIRTLTDLGYLHKDLETKSYSLTPKILSLGFSVLNSMDIRSRLHPLMQEVSLKFGVTVNLSVLQDAEILFVARINSSGLSNLDRKVGTKLPAFCTSMGRCFFAFLPFHEFQKSWKNIKPESFTSYTITDEKTLMREMEQIREKGYAQTYQELTSGWQSLAVPIFEGSNVVAAFGVSFHINTFNDETIELILQDLLRISKNASINAELNTGRV